MIDGAQKAIRMYDSLMKSGKWTAAQNKEKTNDFVDSIGELVLMCEKDGYIEKYYIDKPRDKVDETLEDMKRYTQSLISNESNLVNMIETAIKQNAREDEQEEETDLETETTELTDEDFEEYHDFLAEEEEDDNEDDE